MRVPRLPALLLLLIPLATGCASLTAAGSGSGHDSLVTAEEIAQSGASDAWDAIRKTLPHLDLREDRNGRPARMHRRGASSLLLEDRPSIFLDGVRITDVQRLSQIPAFEIAEIRFLSGIDGTTRYGTNSGDGVIVIQTKAGMS
jgi:hypothetical protein